MRSNMTSERKNIIGRQLSWRISLLSLIALLILPGLAFLAWQVTMRNSQAQLQQTRATVIGVFEEFLWRAADDLWATADALGAGGEAAPLLRRTMARRESSFFEMLWVDVDGRVLASHRRDAVPAVAAPTSQPWWETVKQGAFYIGVLDYDGEGALPLVDMAVPVWDETQNFVGAVVARVDLTPLWNSLKTQNKGPDFRVYATDATGRALLHSEAQLMQQKAVLLSASDLQQLTGFVPVYTQVDGDPVVLVGNRLLSGPWYVVVQQSLWGGIVPFLRQLFLLLLLAVGIVALVISTVQFARREIVTPLRVLHSGVFALEHDLTHPIEALGHGEFAALTNTLNSLAAQLNQTINTLEQRVDERTRGLLAAADVSRSTTAMLDPDALLRETVRLVRDRFDLYYVGLFLLDEEETYLVLQAGTGEPGKQMMATGYRLLLNADAPIARCVTTAQACIALDVGDEAHHFDNPLLPDTRSEMALPLRAQRRAIGALTIQSRREAAFDETNILVMQTMADQVAVAIDNARSYARTQQALHEMELLQQRYLGQAWAEFLRQRPLWGYRKTREGLMPLGRELLAGVDQAMLQRETLITNSAKAADAPQVVVPLRFRDQLLGALGFAVAEGEAVSDEQVAFVEAVAEQFGLAAENLRLMDTTQRLAAREHVVGEVAARIRESLDLDTVLRAAAEQIRVAMQTPEVTIRLRMAEVDHEKHA
ncbi:MAG TPA: GAF domain-containing protein [Anaerolineae bacterium]|nr:GAF domain-containing protein [Anaerolineae bacterium]